MNFGAVQSVEELVDTRGEGDNVMERTFYYCNNIIRDILQTRGGWLGSTCTPRVNHLTVRAETHSFGQ